MCQDLTVGGDVRVKREDLIRELRRIAREGGLAFEVTENRGKGSHYRVKFGDRRTIIKSGELTPLYVRLVKKQLGIEWISAFPSFWTKEKETGDRMNYVFAARLEPDPDGGIIVTFPDVPEAITHGEDRAEARKNAREALGLALRGYLADGEPLPAPKAKGKGLVEIPVEADDALKIAVIEAFKQAGISKAEFARRLGKAVTEAQRILDPDHPSKLPALDAALAMLGKEIVVSVRDAA
jgi:antitoxin HicB